MIVMKFGGTSVGDPAAIRRAVAIVRRERRRRLVVVSALAGVTDRLLEVSSLAAAGEAAAARERLAGLRARHLTIAVEVAPGDAALAARIDDAFRELQQRTDKLAHASETSLALVDAVLVHGELLSSLIAAAAMQATGMPAVWLDAREIVSTDGEHTAAAADVNRTAANAERLIEPLLSADRVPVVGGFVGSGPDGAPTTLGRGGSDVSAALLGAVLGAGEIQIWTDVDGMLTADPRLVPNALPVRHLSYGEAFDLACFGAKVLHPGTVGPAVDRGIPLRILDSSRPGLPGTLIDGRRSSTDRPFTAIACKDGVAVLEVRSRQHLRAGTFLVPVLDTLRALRLNVALVSASDANVSIAVADPDALDESIGALSQLGDVMTHYGLALVCLVGDNVRADAHIVTQVLDEVRTTGPTMIAQPAARCLTVALPREHLRDAVNRLHERFFSAMPTTMEEAAEAGDRHAWPRMAAFAGLRRAWPRLAERGMRARLLRD
jgi:aspartate kinase